MEDPVCPACKAVNDEEAAYCDQCGQHLRAAEAPVEGDCPACGGVVETGADGDGVWLLGQVRESHPDVPFIMMTARIKEIAPLSLSLFQFAIVRLPLSGGWQDNRIFPEKKLLMKSALA